MKAQKNTKCIQVDVSNSKGPCPQCKKHNAASPFIDCNEVVYVTPDIIPRKDHQSL